MSYSYRTVLPTGKTTGQSLFEVLKNVCGTDYNIWHTDPKYVPTLKFAHEVIFNKPRNTFKGVKGGLALRILFLTRASKQTLSTKSKRNCYHDVRVDALAAGVIGVESYHQLMK